MRVHRPTRALMGATVGGLVVAALVAVPTADATQAGGGAQQGTAEAKGALTTQQRAALYKIAKDTWAFYEKDVDPNTHLPLDNLGPGDVRGTYTSAANI